MKTLVLEKVKEIKYLSQSQEQDIRMARWLEWMS
jgi:hypothetical protein